MEADLIELGSAPSGYFTRAQALAFGMVDRDLAVAVRRGRITRLRQGAYALADQHRARDRLERYAVLTRAVIASQRGDVAAAGPSAAVLLGLPLHDVDLHDVHLVRLDGGSARREAGVIHHAVTSDLTNDLITVGGITMTDPARTAWDVARISGVTSGVVIADAACHRQPAASARLLELARIHRYQPYARRAMLASRAADGRSESPGESVCRMQFWRHGIPAPVLQYEVYDDDGVFVGRTDFAWPEFSHLGEFDGKIKYGRLLRDGETPSDVVVREKVREDGLRALRYGMSRFIWPMIMVGQADRTMAALARDLERSRSLYGSRPR